jgi:hypothetical protein
MLARVIQGELPFTLNAGFLRRIDAIDPFALSVE